MIIGVNASFLRKPATGIGQVTTHFLHQLFAMKKDGRLHDVTFLLYTEEEISFALPRGFRNVVVMPRYQRDDLVRKVLWEKYILPRRVKSDRCDAFLSLYQCPTILTSSIKHVMIVHDIIPKIFPEYLGNRRKKLYQKLTDKAINSATQIIAVSQHTKKDLVRQYHIPAEHISVNYIAVDPRFKQPIKQNTISHVMEKYHLTPGYLYTGGGLEVRKNVEHTLRAYKKLLTENHNTPLPPLVLSGKCMPELAPMVTDVERLVDDLDIKKHVNILGFVPQEDLPALYHEALMFLFPSLYEGFGMPVLEAMSCGTPVITTQSASLPEVGGDAVLYCGNGRVEDIAQAMETLLSDETKRLALGSAGKKRAEQFSWETFTQKTLSLLT